MGKIESVMTKVIDVILMHTPGGCGAWNEIKSQNPCHKIKFKFCVK